MDDLCLRVCREAAESLRAAEYLHEKGVLTHEELQLARGYVRGLISSVKKTPYVLAVYSSSRERSAEYIEATGGAAATLNRLMDWDSFQHSSFAAPLFAAPILGFLKGPRCLGDSGCFPGDGEDWLCLVIVEREREEGDDSA